jgi:hypothetical protein
MRALVSCDCTAQDMLEWRMGKLDEYVVAWDAFLAGFFLV